MGELASADWQAGSSRQSMPPDSLRALLSRSVDYAGLFPPASLKLEPALANQATYVCAENAWMLSSFVLPVTKFADAAWFVSAFDEANPLCLSALGAKTIDALDFIEELKTITRAIRQFAGEYRGVVLINQLEMPLPVDVNDAGLEDAMGVLGKSKLRVFWEAPADAAAQTVALLARHNQSSDGVPFGLKLRTGGVTPEAFPTSAQIGRALAATVRHRVPIKFTAGLHHPVRMYRDEVKTKMHGFLNVLGAGVMALQHHWNEQQIAEMLEDENAASFVFHDDEFRWRQWKIASPQIKQHRALVTSFGSCSFDEPRDDLHAIGLL